MFKKLNEELYKNTVRDNDDNWLVYRGIELRRTDKTKKIDMEIVFSVIDCAIDDDLNKYYIDNNIFNKLVGKKEFLAPIHLKQALNYFGFRVVNSDEIG